MKNRVGGSGKGGSSSSSSSTSAAARIPVEAPNTLQSNAVARVIDLLSEGEVDGLVNGLQSVFFDNTALENVDGSLNYTNVQIDTRAGLPDQTPILGFSDVETEVAVGTQVKVGSPGPIVRAISNPDATSVRVTLQIPQLTSTDSSTGDISPTSVSIVIDVQPSWGNYTQVVADTISGKTTSAYERSYRFALFAEGAPWNVRVTRVTADSTSSLLQNSTFWARYTEIEDFQLIYPDSALVAIAVDAQSFGNQVPKRTYEIKGIKLQVPANYDPISRAYIGIWDGTFKTAWSDNPAWVLYDLITNERYGLGQFVPATSVDKFGLYTIAQYCDGLVPDGSGGQEPRFTFNGVIATADDALKVLTTLASVFRGMVFWGPSGVAVACDMPADPVKLVVPANVIDGTINYSGSALKSRHTIAFVTWYDPANSYQPNIEVVEDADAIASFGWRLTEIVAFGCTSRGQAHRFGRWILDSEKNETETATWVASWDQADVFPGDIVEIADPAYSGADFGGRIAGVAGDAKSLTLDRPVTIEAGKSYTISVVLADGTVADRPTITGISTTNILSFNAALSPAPIVGAIWVLTSTSVAPRRFRVIARLETDKHLFQITGLLHDPNKYARIELNITLEAVSYTQLPVGLIAAPTALVASEHLTLVSGGIVRSRVLLSWTASADARVVFYEVQVKPPGQNWQTASPGSTAGISIDLFDLIAGDWGFRVRAISNLGMLSPWLTLETVALAGLLAPPDNITNLHFSHVDLTSTIKWDEITDFRPHRYEIRKGSTWENALQIGDVAHPPFPTVGDDTYWVAAYIGPDAGPKVYSVTPEDVLITGSVIPSNVIASFDQAALGWPGTFTSGGGIDLPDIRTGGDGDITAETDITADINILNLGDQQSSIYTIPTAHRVTLTAPAACRVMIDYAGQGVPVSSDITTEVDVTLDPDITGSASSRSVDVYPEIRLSQDGATWGAWQRFSPGIYTAMAYDARMQLITLDPGVIAYCTKFVFAIDVPDRDDNITNFALGAGGNSFTYLPDGATSNAAFNGGPNGSSLPNISISIRDAVAGDTILRSAESLSGFTLQIQNGGVGVARHVDLVIIGY
jgi:predicted phage tail protein